MKILHINCADFGSTGKIIKDISREAEKEGHLSFLLTPKLNHEAECLKVKATSFPYEQGLYRRITMALGFRYGFAPISTLRILLNIKRIKPDVVHLHSINCNMVNIYSLVKFLKKRHIPTVVTNHAEFFYTGSCAHAYPCERWKSGCGNCVDYKKACGSLWDSSHKAWKKMKNAFEGFDEAYIVSVSPYVYSRSIQSPIFKGIRQTTILNGINTDTFCRLPKVNGEIKTSTGEKTVIAVTARFDSQEVFGKGGSYLVELARRFEKDNVKFLVIGNVTDRKAALPKNLTVLGKISNQRSLAQYYSDADLSVITSYRETFSMPIAESLSCGTPVVGFLAGGPESIAIEDYCKFVGFGDVDAMERLLREEWLDKKRSIDIDEMTSKATEKYASEKMAKKYLDIYKETLK